MNILVLGASSAIGAGVAESFSSGNRLFITGRDASRLRRAADRCRAAGASLVVEMTWDLRRGSGDLKDAAVGWRPDLVINAASAASRLRDHQVAADDMEGILAVDLAVPLDVIRAVFPERESRPVGVVFISSILSVVKSPDREIYGALKRIHERALQGLAAARPDLRLLIVRISKRIPTDGESPETGRLGTAVLNGYREGKRVIYHGAGGRLMEALFNFQPLLFASALKVSRFMQGKSSTSI